MRWAATICAGALGGLLYVGLTWTATLTGLLEWYDQWDNDRLLETVSIAPTFSLLAVFLLGSMLAHRYLAPPEANQRPLLRLLAIGLGFSIGATLTQLGLMHWGGVAAPRARLVAGFFLGSSLLISLLAAAFYRFMGHH